MSERRLTVEDREEIFYALEFKARSVECGESDEFHGEATRPGSEILRWTAHFRRIMAKIALG
jgi:hypothetical protein